jgi:uncharacterized membrane protein YgcG
MTALFTTGAGVRACSVLLFFLCAPLFVNAEYIDSFTADIDVRKDGTFTVSERIDYRFSEDRHGIIREIPLLHPERSESLLKERIIDIELKSVTLDGNSVPYAVESTSDMFVVRVGDSDTTLRGPHLYTIEYEVKGGVSYPKGQGTELYWNITGNEWDVPIRSVEATLRTGDSIFLPVRSCYRGTLGSTSGSCQVTQDASGNISFRTAELMQQEGMTIAQALDATKVTKDVRERTNVLFLLVPILGAMFLIGGYKAYRYKTAFRTGRTVIPQYEPYPMVKPMYAGLLMDGRLDPRDFTACIVYLAEQGYLTIKKTEQKVLFLFDVDDYEITLTKVPDHTLGVFERKVLELLFDAPLSEGAVISLSALKQDRMEQRKNHVAFQALQHDLREDLRAAGFYEHFSLQHLLIIFGGILLTALAVSFVITRTVSVPILAFMGSVGVITLLILNRRRTTKGYESLDHLKGFKLFLSMTDRDRYAFHNAPEKSPEQFMEYLPYAIAFGVEKEWAKVFEGLTIPDPNWYDGGNVSAFSPTDLSSSLGAFSTAFAASSGTSASAGGGSAGGGAGGGGGSSW